MIAITVRLMRGKVIRKIGKKCCDSKKNTVGPKIASAYFRGGVTFMTTCGHFCDHNLVVNDCVSSIAEFCNSIKREPHVIINLKVPPTRFFFGSCRNIIRKFFFPIFRPHDFFLDRVATSFVNFFSDFPDDFLLHIMRPCHNYKCACDH